MKRIRAFWLVVVFFGATAVSLAQTAAPDSKELPSSGTAVSTTGGDEAAAEKKPDKVFGPQNQCVDQATNSNEFKTELKSGRRPVGDTIVVDTNFLPTGQPVNVGIRTAYADKLRFFAAVETPDGIPDVLARQDVITRRAVPSDSLVKKKLLEADQTIVNLTIDEDDAGYWQKADLYLYTCGADGSPARVSKINIRLSPYWSTLSICAISIVLAYIWIGYITRKQDHTFSSFLYSLNPVTVTAGADGKGSLSKFQILSFSLTVFGLILLLMLQSGVLSDLSATILALLGISGIGATIAKGADAQRITIAPENRAWLLRKGWLTTGKKDVDTSKAAWRDFFTTDGEFDVYRYQSFIFGLVVIFAMIAAGVTQLSTFTIPDTILGIVGLSQAVYIGGKLVTPTNIGDVNAAVADLRDREKKFRDAATAKKQGKVADTAEAASLLGQVALDAYRDKARDVAAIFTDETGKPVPDAGLDPAFD
jgi:hypothetical protein